MEKIKSFLKNHPALFNLFFFLQHLPREMRSFLPRAFFGKRMLARTERAFHGDPVSRNAIGLIFKTYPITAVVETGTYQGSTTAYLAGLFPKSVFTCEVVGLYYRESRIRLRKFRNIISLKGSSSAILERLRKNAKLGDCPFFFLDAHWYRYWPLLDELSVVNQMPRAVVVIDDFKIPGKPWFGYDAQDNPDGTKTDEDLNFISPALDPRRSRVFLPKYGKAGDDLRGHAIIFNNAGDELSRLMKDNFFASHYEERGIGK